MELGDTNIEVLWYHLLYQPYNAGLQQKHITVYLVSYPGCSQEKRPGNLPVFKKYVHGYDVKETTAAP